ncbi:hypothetical protein [Micromonospora sp. NPDC049679]|uniref:hypothetical protein n=1 Tax=Micromonospora sp. NPDC049679 TaxID=3155920 RepID=UPI0033DB1723
MAKSGGRRKELIKLGFLLLLGAVLLPEKVSEGSWRAWVGVPLGVGVLWLFLTELRAAIRMRRRSGSSEQEI